MHRRDRGQSVDQGDRSVRVDRPRGTRQGRGLRRVPGEERPVPADPRRRSPTSMGRRRRPAPPGSPPRGPSPRRHPARTRRRGWTPASPTAMQNSRCELHPSELEVGEDGPHGPGGPRPTQSPHPAIMTQLGNDTNTRPAAGWPLRDRSIALRSCDEIDRRPAGFGRRRRHLDLAVRPLRVTG